MGVSRGICNDGTPDRSVLSLPLEKLDALAVKKEVDRIGRE
jgi:hypothetical protein